MSTGRGAGPGPAARRWADQLAAWAIPEEILAAAPESPWGFPPGLFRASDEGGASPSRRRALEALEPGDVVLDVGVGAGAASLPLSPPAARVVGVDESEAMLAELREEAARRGVAVDTIEGRWPDVAPRAPVADLVICHHVFYNVADLPAFALALTDHARRTTRSEPRAPTGAPGRVVVELTAAHPLSNLAPLWRHFHGLERPSGPTVDDAVAVLEECGITPHVERAERQARWQDADRAELVAFVRRRLCLPAERDPEIEPLFDRGPLLARQVATLWW